MQTEEVGAALNETKSALASISVLKKICDHPALLTDKAANTALDAKHRRKPGAHSSRAQHLEDASSSEDGRGGYDSLDDFVVSNSDEAASTSSADSDESSSGSDESDDEGGAAKGKRRYMDNAQRVAHLDEQVQGILGGLGAEFENLSEQDVLDRLHSKQDRDSCKTGVRFSLVCHTACIQVCRQQVR